MTEDKCDRGQVTKYKLYLYRLEGPLAAGHEGGVGPLAQRPWQYRLDVAVAPARVVQPPPSILCTSAAVQLMQVAVEADSVTYRLYVIQVVCSSGYCHSHLHCMAVSSHACMAVSSHECAFDDQQGPSLQCHGSRPHDTAVPQSPHIVHMIYMIYMPLVALTAYEAAQPLPGPHAGQPLLLLAALLSTSPPAAAAGVKVFVHICSILQPAEAPNGCSIYMSYTMWQHNTSAGC